MLRYRKSSSQEFLHVPWGSDRWSRIDLFLSEAMIWISLITSSNEKKRISYISKYYTRAVCKRIRFARIRIKQIISVFVRIYSRIIQIFAWLGQNINMVYYFILLLKNFVRALRGKEEVLLTGIHVVLLVVVEFFVWCYFLFRCAWGIWVSRVRVLSHVW